MKFKLNKILIKFIPINVESDVIHRIFKGTLWGTFGGTITRVFTIIFSFLLARVLGSEALGEYGMINSTSTSISSIAGLGLGATISRYSATLKVSNPKRLGNIIGLTFAIGWVSAIIYGILYFALSTWIASSMLNAPHLSNLMKISAFSFMFGLVNSIQNSSLMGLEAFKITSIISTITTIVQTFLILVFSYFYGLNGAIICGSITSIGIFVVFYIYSRKEYKKRGIVVSFVNLKSEIKVIWGYCLPAFLSSLVTGPVIWFTNTMLIKEPNGFSQLGIFNVASQWDNVVRFLPMYIGSAAIPVMTDITMNDSFKSGFTLTIKLMKTIFLISLPIAIIVSLFSTIIIKGYGDTFAGGENTIVITVFTTVLILTSNQVGSYISATGKMWVGLILNIIWGISFVALSYLLINMGAFGLATSKLIAYVFHFILSLLLCFVFLNKK